MARLLLFNKKQHFKIVECNELNDYYEALECSVFDIARRKVGDKYFDIFVDDMGLLIDNPVVTAINSKGEPMLVGNLIFANHDSEGNTIGLTAEDIVTVMSAICIAVNKGTNETRRLILCEY